MDQDYRSQGCGWFRMKGKKDHPYFAYYYDKGERISIGRYKTKVEAQKAVLRVIKKTMTYR